MNSRIEARAGVRGGVTNQMSDRQRSVCENICGEWNARGFFAGQQEFDECNRIEPGPLGSEARGIVKRGISHRERQVRVHDLTDAVSKLPMRGVRTVVSHTYFR